MGKSTTCRRSKIGGDINGKKKTKRKFNGETYILMSSLTGVDKRNADVWKDNCKSAGEKVRVLKRKGKYYVYARNK